MKDATERRYRIQGNAEAFLTDHGISSGMLTCTNILWESIWCIILDYICA